MATTDPSIDRDVPPSRDVLLQQLTDVLARSGHVGLTAVGVSFVDGDIELALKALDCHDVVQGLAGFRAPAAWDAFALVARATARHIERRAWSQAVTVAVLASRDGGTASAVRRLHADGDDTSGEPRDELLDKLERVNGGEGRVLDTCRRVLGLPTAPPTHTTALWSAIHWVDAALSAVLAAELGTKPSWQELRRLDRGRRHAEWPWSLLRADCAAGRLRIPTISRDAAAWMDDGMFSREVMTAYPPVAEMVADLRELLPRDTYNRLLAAICERMEPGSTADLAL